MWRLIDSIGDVRGAAMLAAGYAVFFSGPLLFPTAEIASVEFAAGAALMMAGALAHAVGFLAIFARRPWWAEAAGLAGLFIAFVAIIFAYLKLIAWGVLG